MSDVVQLIVGLGNPGLEYEKTRHNAGAFFVDAICQGFSGSYKNESRFFGQTAQVTIGAHSVKVLKPATYMNESGKAIAAMANFYKIPPESILVAHDELDLPPGTARLKQGGGHGGHNGLRHTIQCLGNNKDFQRLRIGIGHPGQANQVTGFVLSKPSSQEQTLIDDSIADAIRVIEQVISGNLNDAMHKLHTQK